MRRKVLAGLLVLSMTASLFSGLGYIPSQAAKYEPQIIANEDESATLISAGEMIASGDYSDWSWSLDQTGLLQITGTITKPDSGWPWEMYREDVKTVTVSGSGIGDISEMFCDCINLASADLSKFDTSKVTDMYAMFAMNIYPCNNSLTTLDLSNFNTEHVTNMAYMFSGCLKLKSLNVSNFDTKNVTFMTYMFSDCNSLSSLNINNFNTENVLGMAGMFYNCNGLTTLDVSSFDTEHVEYMNYMFYGCCGLTTLDLSNFNAKSLVDGDSMFGNCSGLGEICGGLREIKSPYNIPVTIKFPSNTVWIDEDGEILTTMHKNLSNSVTYKYHSYSDESSSMYYIIHFDKNGATSGSMSDLSCESDTTYDLTANTFTRTGFLFNGWNTSADGSGIAYVDEAEVSNLTTEDGGVVTLYAQWKPISYTIHFEKNGGTSGSMSRIYPKYGRYYRLPACGFKKPGYAMTGWNTKKDGTGTTYKNCSNVKNLTTENGKVIILYAQWKKVTVPTVSKPTLGNYVAGRLTVKYNKVPGAAGYLVQYSTNKNMTNAKNVSCTGTTKNIYGLKKGTTYYVRVRAYKVDSAGKKVYGKFGAVQYKKLTK